MKRPKISFFPAPHISFWNTTGHHIAFNICRGSNDPWNWGFAVAQSCRIGGDHVGTWKSTKSGISQMVRVPREFGGKPYGWNGIDILQTGNGNQVGYDRTFPPPSMTLDESITEFSTEFSMWAISASSMLVTTPIMNCTATTADDEDAEENHAVMEGAKQGDTMGCSVSLIKQLSHTVD